MRPQIMMLFGISLDASREEVQILKNSIDEAFDDRDAKEVKPETIKPTKPQEAPALAPDNGGGNAPDNGAPAAPQEVNTGITHSFDSAGVPWDSRIHSTPATAKADGTWRARRGVDPATAARITAELLSTVSAPAAPAPVVTAPAPVVTAPPAPAPVAPPAPILPPAPTVDPAYTAFVQYIASITLSPDNPSGRVDADWVKGVLTNFGVAGGEMQNLLHRIDLIPQIEAAIKGALA